MINKTSTYYPHLNGIRGLAILLIIFSHLNFLIFPPGGINIFFVLSGFLITKILISKNKNFKITKFYITRFNNLYPQLSITILITYLFFILLGDLNHSHYINRSAVTSLFAIFNFYLIKIEDVYFLRDTINPFLPIWAFSVIIQFYFIYPIILKTLFNFLRFNSNTKYLVFFILLSILLYFLYYFNRDNFIGNYYSPIAHFWKFFLGCSLFFFKARINTLLKNIYIILILFLLLFWQCLYFNINNYLVIEIVIVSFIALCLLIRDERSFFNNFLSLKIFTFFGSRSYPLYLLHMPLIYFIFPFNENLLGKIMIFVFTVILSEILYNIKKINLFLNYFNYFKLLLIPTLLIIIACSFLYFQDKSNIINFEKNYLNHTYSKINLINRNMSKYNITYEPWYNFSFGKKLIKNIDCSGLNNNEYKFKYYLENLNDCKIKNNSSKLVIFFGTSHTEHYFPSFNLKDKDIDYYFFQNPFTPNFYFLSEKEHYNQKFDILIQKKNLFEDFFRYYLQISKKKENYIFISERFFEYVDKKFFYNSNLELVLEDDIKYQIIYREFKLFIKNKINKETKIIFVANTPQPLLSYQECMYKQGFILDKCNYKSSTILNKREKTLNIYNKLAEEFTNVKVIDPYLELCPNKICSFFKINKDEKLYPLISDKSHLNVEASRRLNKFFLKIFD